jgi:hypothetical protein
MAQVLRVFADLTNSVTRDFGSWLAIKIQPYLRREFPNYVKFLPFCLDMAGFTESLSIVFEYGHHLLVYYSLILSALVGTSPLKIMHLKFLLYFLEYFVKNEVDDNSSVNSIHQSTFEFGMICDVSSFGPTICGLEETSPIFQEKTVLTNGTLSVGQYVHVAVKGDNVIASPVFTEKDCSFFYYLLAGIVTYSLVLLALFAFAWTVYHLDILENGDTAHRQARHFAEFVRGLCGQDDIQVTPTIEEPMRDYVPVDPLSVDENLNCPICYCEFDDTVVKHKSCNGYYHKKCIKEWLEIKTQCPYCCQ